MLKYLLLFSISLPSFAQGSSIDKFSEESCRLDSQYDTQLKALDTFRKSGVSPYVPTLQNESLHWRRISEYVGELFGEPGPRILLTSAHELRFLPNSLDKSQLLLIVGKDDGLNQRRLKDLVDVARFKDISISTLWIGPGDSKLLGLLPIKLKVYRSSLSILKDACSIHSWVSEVEPAVGYISSASCHLSAWWICLIEIRLLKSRSAIVRETLSSFV